MKTKMMMLFFGLGLLVTLSCSKYPPSSDRLLEDMAILTQYDVKVDFNQFKTFSIDNDIVYIKETDTVKHYTNANVTAVINQVRSNMKARGFIEVASSATPDLRFGVVYYENTTVYAYYGYDWYYPYYGWGWYYPYYPTYYTTYTTGLADFELIDMKNTAPNNTKYLRWSAFIRGLLTGTHTTADVTHAIDQAFTQTPQLATTK